MVNPESNKLQYSAINTKQAANRVNNFSSQVRNEHESKSIKNFRVRKDSDGAPANRNRSCDNTKVKVNEQMMYVPALEDKSYNNEPSKDNESQLCELQFKFDQKEKSISVMEGFNLQERNISFSNIHIPQFP